MTRKRSKMAGFRDREKQFFPLQNIEDVVKLFKDQLTSDEEPNLPLLSIVLGVIENILTVHRAAPTEVDSSKILEPIFPVIELETVEALHSKFVALIKKSVDLTKFPQGYATRELVKFVSDVIWCSLTRAYYKDKAHLQSLYSFLTGNKLDCFGVAFAVVAAFQVLEYNDVHLALSEDHAWVVFGEDQRETAEVTWHGKGNEDKRGQPITEGVADKSWLYLNGQPVICTRQMEVASIVSGINPSITLSTDSVELAALQQELLWLLHDMGHLDKYPMALGNLGDLEEISHTPEKPPAVRLFEEAIESTKKHYNNQHVYPYTYMGGYHYRRGNYKEALQAWADATSALKNYNYNREDEEIYKEFLDIANNIIPHMMKQIENDNAGRIHHTTILYDPESYANFLRFYDGICEWEEDSPTPVLHITWAKQLVFSLGKFDASVRGDINLKGENGEEEESGESESDSDSETENKDKNQNVTDRKDVNKIEEDLSTKSSARSIRGRKQGRRVGGHTKRSKEEDSTEVNGDSKEEELKSVIEELESKVEESSEKEPINPSISDLAKACGEGILNPDYLLGGEGPFTTANTTMTVSTSTTDSRVDYQEFLSSKSNGSPFMGMTVDSMLKAESPSDMVMYRKRPSSTRTPTPIVDSNSNAELANDEGTVIPSPLPKGPPVLLCLRSEKMKGLKKIFSSPKLNANAIKLQLTAQSQVHFKHNKRSTDSDLAPLRKRSRRE